MILGAEPVRDRATAILPTFVHGVLRKRRIGADHCPSDHGDGNFTDPLLTGAWRADPSDAEGYRRCGDITIGLAP